MLADLTSTSQLALLPSLLLISCRPVLVPLQVWQQLVVAALWSGLLSAAADGRLTISITGRWCPLTIIA